VNLVIFVKNPLAELDWVTFSRWTGQRPTQPLSALICFRFDNNMVLGPPVDWNEISTKKFYATPVFDCFRQNSSSSGHAAIAWFVHQLPREKTSRTTYKRFLSLFSLKHFDIRTESHLTQPASHTGKCDVTSGTVT